MDGARIVQFAHFSVKEFLTSDRLSSASEDLSPYHIVPHLAHSTLARSSLSVLLQLDDRIDKDSITNFPLADYAARYWFIHSQFTDVESTIQDSTERLFDREMPHFAVWVWIHDIDDPWREPTPTTRPEWPEAQPLYYAVLCGLRWLIEHLIYTYPGDVNSRGGWHETPLLAAFMMEDLDAASLLLRSGADVNVLDNERWSPLHRASSDGRVDIVRFLLEYSADVNLPGHKNFTPLLLASSAGGLEISRLLVQHGADVNARTLTGWTPLIFALIGDKVDIVHLLLDNGADVNSVCDEGLTPLLLAIHCHDGIDVLELLLEHGADFNICDEDGQTLVDIASKKGLHEVAYFLSDFIAAATPLDGTINPTPSTLKRYHRTPKELELEGSSGGARPFGGETTKLSLYTASGNGQYDLVRSLLDGGSDVNARYKNRMTALHVASYKGKLEVAKLLIERGADLDSRSRAGWTALHYALREGHPEVVRLLLDHGADANAKTRNDGNALHLALFARSVPAALEVIQLLLDHGADENSNVRNNRGRTPRQEATAMGYYDLEGLHSHCYYIGAH